MILYMQRDLLVTHVTKAGVVADYPFDRIANTLTEGEGLPAGKKYVEEMIVLFRLNPAC
jgi:hypothetical protein